jgi:PAS domain S-box-containing protein
MGDALQLVSRLMEAHKIEDILGAGTDLLVETSGASSAASFLVRGDDVVAEDWHGSAHALREGARPSLTTGLGGKRVQEVKLDDPEMHWVRVASRSAGGQHVMAALTFDGKPSVDPKRIEIAQTVVEIMARRLDLDRQLIAGRAELAKFKRWLEISNSQMLVLDRERQKFAAVVGQSDLLMFVCDQDNVARWANVSLKTRHEELGGERIEGLAVEEIWEILGVDCPPPTSPDCPIAKVFDKGSVEHCESRQKTDDGTRILYLTFLPVRGVDGRTAEVLIMIQDLSELDAVRRSESRYRHMFERSPNAIIMAGSDTGRILAANIAAILLTGYPAGELEGMTLEQLHEPGEWQLASKQYARTVERDQVRRFERPMRGKDGKTFTASITTYRFELDGEPVTVLDLQDVTKQRQLEAELRLSQLPPEPDDDF